MKVAGNLEEEIDKSKQKKSKGVKKPLGKVILTVFLSLLLLLVLSYGSLTLIAFGKSLPYLNLVGTNVGSKSKTELYTLVKNLSEQRKGQRIKISFENKDETNSFQDLGLELNTNETVEKIYDFGKFKGIFPSPQYIFQTAQGALKVQPLVSWNKEADKKISDMVSDKKKDSENPKITYSNGSLKIEPEKAGYNYNTRTLSDALETCYLKKTCESVLAFKTATRSNVTANDLVPFEEQFSQIAGMKLTLSYSSRRFYPSAENLISFIDPERTVLDQKIGFNNKAIEDYLNSISTKVNTKAKDKVISTYDNAVIDEGQEGVAIDIEQNRELLKKAIIDRDKNIDLVAKTTPIGEKFVGPGFTPGKYPGKYIEVNLSEQMLYLMEGTNNTKSFKVSTGKWSMPTPLGEYTVNNKVPRAYSQEYGLYMPYWMAFIGSQYGIHELPEWPDGRKEGEGHLGTPVSHGCIRLGRGAAEEVYNWTDVGTPVYIHI